MHRMPRFLISLFLGASLIAPLGMQAIDKDHDHDHDKRDRRYYDRERRDYHNWNEHEQAAYRHWLMEERREREYRDYNRLNRERQADYWRWRHEHADWH